MDINGVLNYLEQYGLYFLFLIVFLEYLNLPGLPAGIIMPAIGILISRGDKGFLLSLIVSVVAGVLGSLVLYVIGYYLGKPLLDKIYEKYQKTRKPIDKVLGYVERYGDKSAFVSRVIPVARTIISLIAGTTRMDLMTFFLYSTPGILIWNFVYIYVGYAFGHLFLS